MDITNITGLRTEDGTTQYNVPQQVYGKYDPVEILLKPENPTFNTFEYSGMLDTCDEQHSTITTSNQEITFYYGSDADRETTTIENNQVECNKVILYFNPREHRGLELSSDFLSQIEELRSPFPEYVNIGWVTIDSERFRTTAGLTLNTIAKPVINADSTIKVFPRIFANTESLKTFPNTFSEQIEHYYQPAGRANYDSEWSNLEAVEYQGELSNIETLLPFDLSNLTTGSSKIQPINVLEAYNRGGAPKHIIGFYNVREGFIHYTQLPQDKTIFYNPENLETFMHSFDINISYEPVEAGEEELTDTLPLTPEYNNGKLRVLHLPHPQVKLPNNIRTKAFGSTLLYHPTPQGVISVENTHYYNQSTGVTPNGRIETLTYAELQAEAGFTKQRENAPTRFTNTQLPEGIKQVYKYYSDYPRKNVHPENTNYEPLPTSTILVKNYFCFNLHEIPETLMKIPALPENIRMISGYCSNLFNGIYKTITNKANALIIELEQVETFQIEDNKCGGCISIDGWMNNTYLNAGIDLSYNTTNFIKPLPTLSTDGRSNNSFRNAFRIRNIIGDRYERKHKGSPFDVIYSHEENRALPLSIFENILTDLSGYQHLNSYEGAWNGNYNGEAMNWINKSSAQSTTAFNVNDAYGLSREFAWEIDIEYSEEELVILNNDEELAKRNNELKKGVLTLNGEVVDYNNRALS